MCSRAASCFLAKAASSARFGGARLHEGVVAAGVERQLAVLQMQDEFDRACSSRSRSWLTISTRAAIALEEILQPQRAFEIEIVGGLVQQQQIGRGEQDRRQRHAHAPAAGEFASRAAAALRRGSRGRRGCRAARAGAE